MIFKDMPIIVPSSVERSKQAVAWRDKICLSVHEISRALKVSVDKAISMI